MVLFAVERWKESRMQQSKAGVVNKDYRAQKSMLPKIDKGEVLLTDVRSNTRERFAAELAGVQ